MKQTSMLLAVRIAVILLTICNYASAFAEERVVKGMVTQWKPLVTFAQPGDTIKFVNMIGHDTASIESMIPDGATPWKSKLGEEGFSITVDREGAYIYKCSPHISMGMVGTIVVGNANPSVNSAQVEMHLADVKIAKNMVNRAIKKMKKALEHKAK